MTGRGSKVGIWLCTNPDVDAITLTGFTEAGIETAHHAADHLAHAALELGGNDAFILLPDGDVDLALDELVWGRMYNTGQVCCASKRFLIHRSLVDEFTSKAVARISALKQGDPADESTQIGCLISEKAAIKAEEQVKLTIEQGGTVILGGHRTGTWLTMPQPKLGQAGLMALLVLTSLAMPLSLDMYTPVAMTDRTSLASSLRSKPEALEALWYMCVPL